MLGQPIHAGLLRVQLFKSESLDQLEDAINVWLAENDRTKIHDIQIQRGGNETVAMIVHALK